MATLVFVHGIGARADSQAELKRSLREAILRDSANFDLRFCDWGDDLGAAAAEVRRALPDDVWGPWRPGAAAEELSLSERDALLWAALTADPLAEMRILADAPVFSGAGDRPSADVGEEIYRILRALPADAEAVSAFDRAGLPGRLGPAVDRLAAHGVTSRALDNTATLEDDVRIALARAVTAEAGAGRTDQGTLAALCDLVAARLGAGAQSGIGRFAMRAVVGVAASLISGPAVAELITPFVGDTMRYLSRGAVIRERIAAVLAGARPPVVLMGHSLGGVAALDLVVERGRSGPVGVDMLMTVGSQASYLWAIDTLPSLVRGQLPGPGVPFPRWENFYDPRDRLSFPAEPLLGRSLVRDHRIDTGALFPAAHRAYFRTEKFRTVLSGLLAEAVA